MIWLAYCTRPAQIFATTTDMQVEAWHNETYSYLFFILALIKITVPIINSSNLKNMKNNNYLQVHLKEFLKERINYRSHKNVNIKMPISWAKQIICMCATTKECYDNTHRKIPPPLLFWSQMKVSECDFVIVLRNKIIGLNTLSST